MNATITIRVIKQETITFNEWVKQDLYTTKRCDYPPVGRGEAMFQAALTREWNRILNECGATIELDGGEVEEEEIHEAFEVFACADADQEPEEEEEIPTLSQEEAQQ